MHGSPYHGTLLRKARPCDSKSADVHAREQVCARMIHTKIHAHRYKLTYLSIYLQTTYVQVHMHVQMYVHTDTHPPA